MAKKFINGENLVYALGEFEKKVSDMIESVTDIMMADNQEINDLFTDTQTNTSNLEENK